MQQDQELLFAILKELCSYIGITFDYYHQYDPHSGTEKQNPRMIRLVELLRDIHSANDLERDPTIIKDILGALLNRQHPSYRPCSEDTLNAFIYCLCDFEEHEAFIYREKDEKVLGRLEKLIADYITCNTNRWLAFLESRHHRLGAKSAAQILPPELTLHILERASGRRIPMEAFFIARPPLLDVSNAIQQTENNENLALNNTSEKAESSNRKAGKLKFNRVYIFINRMEFVFTGILLSIALALFLLSFELVLMIILLTAGVLAIVSILTTTGGPILAASKSLEILDDELNIGPQITESPRPQQSCYPICEYVLALVGLSEQQEDLEKQHTL
jgi:hypothetical protein